MDNPEREKPEASSSALQSSFTHERSGHLTSLIQQHPTKSHHHQSTSQNKYALKQIKDVGVGNTNMKIRLSHKNSRWATKESDGYQSARGPPPKYISEWETATNTQRQMNLGRFRVQSTHEMAHTDKEITELKELRGEMRTIIPAIKTNVLTLKHPRKNRGVEEGIRSPPLEGAYIQEEIPQNIILGGPKPLIAYKRNVKSVPRFEHIKYPAKLVKKRELSPLRTFQKPDSGIYIYIYIVDIPMFRESMRPRIESKRESPVRQGMEEDKKRKLIGKHNGYMSDLHLLSPLSNEIGLTFKLLMNYSTSDCTKQIPISSKLDKMQNAESKQDELGELDTVSAIEHPQTPPSPHDKNPQKENHFSYHGEELFAIGDSLVGRNLFDDVEGNNLIASDILDKKLAQNMQDRALFTSCNLISELEELTKVFRYIYILCIYIYIYIM